MESLGDLARLIGELLTERQQTVAVAESAAGGLISAALLSVPGASAFFLGGGVIYTRDARRGLLGLSGKQATMRAATEDYAALVARKMRERLGATWGLGESGAAGPTGNRYGDEPGLVCLAVAGPIQKAETLLTELTEREANMWTFATSALELLEETVRAYTGEVTVYGLENCDTCRKALNWLADEKIKHRFHDVRADGLEAWMLNLWINQLGWNTLLNRRATAWRQIPDSMRENVSPVTAASLMLANPVLIKRPIFDLGGQYLVGFKESQMEALRAVR